MIILSQTLGDFPLQTFLPSSPIPIFKSLVLLPLSSTDTDESRFKIIESICIFPTFKPYLVLFNFSNSSIETSKQPEQAMLGIQENSPELADFGRREPILCEESASSNEIAAAERGECVIVAEEVSEIAEDGDETTLLFGGDQPQCRICLDVGGEDLIAPCNCKGTQKYVHRSCLDNWRSTKEGFAFSHCTECRSVFILRANVPPDRWWLRLRFQLLVARDHAFIFITVQLVVAFLGLLVYKFYGEELREMFGYEEHPYGFYTMAVLAIVLVGLLYGFFIAIICGQRINERHYHVLAKQELTKEFIVEDRECKDVPELEQSHVMELRMLGLY